MKNLLQQIEKLLNSLPNKDRNKAKDFINKRKFEDLHNLITSDIYKVEKDSNKEVHQYPEANLDNMHLLRALVMDYLDNLDSDKDSLDTFNDYEEF
jgi:hypothetical protein